jgi:hypothetical protein
LLGSPHATELRSAAASLLPPRSRVIEQSLTDCVEFEASPSCRLIYFVAPRQPTSALAREVQTAAMRGGWSLSRRTSTREAPSCVCNDVACVRTSLLPAGRVPRPADASRTRVIAFRRGTQPRRNRGADGHSIETLLGTYVAVIEELRGRAQESAEKLIQEARGPKMDRSASEGGKQQRGKRLLCREALFRTRTGDPLLTIEQRGGNRGQARVTSTEESPEVGGIG